MTACLLDGQFVASTQRLRLRDEITARCQVLHRAPGLAVILLGDDPASQIYVKHKRKACQEMGIQSFAYDLPDNTTQSTLLNLIDTLNQLDTVDGILVQLPLPTHIDSTCVLERILPTKDVDGFHPYNLGRLAQGNPLLRPCTPYGVIQLLTHYEIPLKGQHVVVVGASNIVGRPMALECLLAKATVTVCHSQTHDLERHVRSADLIIVAIGNYNVVKTEWMNTKQVLVDVGMHRRSDGTLHGDVDFASAKNTVGYLTPVPGGIGPMTILTLLQNTLLAFDRHHKS